MKFTRAANGRPLAPWRPHEPLKQVYAEDTVSDLQDILNTLEHLGLSTDDYNPELISAEDSNDDAVYMVFSYLDPDFERKHNAWERAIEVYDKNMALYEIELAKWHLTETGAATKRKQDEEARKRLAHRGSILKKELAELGMTLADIT